MDTRNLVVTDSELSSWKTSPELVLQKEWSILSFDLPIYSLLPIRRKIPTNRLALSSVLGKKCRDSNWSELQNFLTGEIFKVEYGDRQLQSLYDWKINSLILSCNFIIDLLMIYCLSSFLKLASPFLNINHLNLDDWLFKWVKCFYIVKNNFRWWESVELDPESTKKNLMNLSSCAVPDHRAVVEVHCTVWKDTVEMVYICNIRTEKDH